MATVDAESARARVLALAPEGFEEVELGSELELAAYVDSEREERLRAIFRIVDSVPVEPGWEHRWRAFHRSVRAGGVWIGPPWESPPADEPAVVVDPGRAFGTGAHATTRACIELLARIPAGSLLDAGCGSGVVAVAAARLGFEPLFAVDEDPDAVEATARTAEANGVSLTARVADVLVDNLPHVDVLVANIELGTVEALLERRPASTAITSGYLVGDAPAARGWKRVARLEPEGWAADLLEAT